MSQKTKRGSVSVEEKNSSDSPVREMKKKAAAEKERAEKGREEKTDKPASSQNNGKAPSASEKNGTPAVEKKEVEKPSDNNEKKPVPESTKAVEAKQSSSKTPAKTAEKAASGAEKATNSAEKAASGNQKAANGAEKAASGNQKAANGTEKPGSSSEKANGTEKAGKEALNGSVEKPGDAVDPDTEQEDELFPELAYDDGSDEDSTPAARSVTRRSQVKAARTPETPRPASNKTPAEDKSEDVPPAVEKETKLLKMRDEFAASSMKLRSGDPADKPDVTEDNEVAALADESTTVKTDTNFSKSRIKVSPYRRSMRLQDSLVANYTGNNTTMETDLSQASEAASQVEEAGPRAIRGRRSYKTLGEFVPSPRRNRVTVGADLRPTVHVVGRKRKTEEDDDTGLEFPSTLEDSVVPEASAKRMRLLERVVTPFTSLLRRRTVASSTPLPLRRSHAIVGINSDLPLHGDVHIAPEVLPAPSAEGEALLEPEVLKTAPAEVAEIALEAREMRTRQKCAVM